MSNTLCTGMVLKKEKLVKPSGGKTVEQLELSHITGGNAKWHTHPGRRLAEFFFRLNINLLYDLV